MSDAFRNRDEVRETVQLANHLVAWLKVVGAETTGAGVDLADSVAALKQIERLLREMRS